MRVLNSWLTSDHVQRQARSCHSSAWHPPRLPPCPLYKRMSSTSQGSSSPRLLSRAAPPHRLSYSSSNTPSVFWPHCLFNYCCIYPDAPPAGIAQGWLPHLLHASTPWSPRVLSSTPPTPPGPRLLIFLHSTSLSPVRCVIVHQLPPQLVSSSSKQDPPCPFNSQLYPKGPIRVGVGSTC